MSSNEWKDINENSEREFLKATEIDSVEGTLVAIEPNRQYEGKSNLLFEREDGTQFLLMLAGTLNYAVKDGKFVVGNEYRIVRDGSKTIADGKYKGTKMANFKVMVRTANSQTPTGRKAAGKKTEVAV